MSLIVIKTKTGTVYHAKTLKPKRIGFILMLTDELELCGFPLDCISEIGVE